VTDYAKVADFHGVVMSLSVFAVPHFLSAIFPVLLAKPPIGGEKICIPCNSLAIFQAEKCWLMTSTTNIL
jgi:hypothetical protein